MRPLEAVLFDFSDTLFRQDRTGRAVELAAACGVRLDLDATAAVSREVVAAAVTPTELAKGRDLSAERHRECWTTLLRAYDRLAPSIVDPPLSVRLYDDAVDGRGSVPFEDTRAVLETLRDRGVRVGVVSDIGWDVRRPFVHHGMERLVSVYVTSFAHGCEKPDRRLFQAACDALGVDMTATLMVGDSPDRDGGAARHGLRAYILPPWTGGGPRGLSAAVALVDASRA